MVIGLFGCWMGLVQSIHAQATRRLGDVCSPANLDVSALPISSSFAYGGHLFVLEIQNIGPSACTLQTPRITLEPTSDTNNQPRYAEWKEGDSESKPEPYPVLEPGAWAHLIFVWTSQAGLELSCDQYSGMRLGFAFQAREQKEVEIKVRHLWVRACGPFGVTGYRPGRYSRAEIAPKDWRDWFGPGGLAGLTFSLPTPSGEIAISPLLSLRAQTKRAMLGDRLFSLKLIFPRQAVKGCSFSQLRRRESDGSTVISIQQCDDTGMVASEAPLAVPWYHEAGVLGLAMGNLDFMPKHSGVLEYDVTAPVGQGTRRKGETQYGRTRVELVARDPALPLQVAVLDSLPACTANQIRIEAIAPVIATPKKTLRGYNATNISPQACSLAGVPRARGLDEKGNYQPFMPPVCPNCDNEFFTARPNGRIDLKSGETAHLLAAATGNEAAYCMSTSKLEVSFNRDASPKEPFNTGPLPEQIRQSAYLPFEAHDCVALDVSAWRQGPYDGAPLTLGKTEIKAPGGAASKASIPLECDKPELLAHGQPHLIEGTHDPQYALSMVQHQFVSDEPITLYQWMINSSDRAITISGCGVGSAQGRAGFVLYDAYGHRVLNHRQVASEQKCKESGAETLDSLICTSMALFTVQAHTCTSTPGDLTQMYELPPGEYTISPRAPGDSPSCPRKSEGPYKRNTATDITFNVLQP
jgi:hypothetical protein